MATKNLVSAALTDADKTAIKQAIQTASEKMPFLISLTDEQRRGGLKLGDKTVGFVDKVMSYSQTNPSLVPSYLDTAEFTKDYQLTKDLLDVLRILRPLMQNIEDTSTEAGVEALAAAMVFYNAVKGAAKQGVPGAKAIYEDLQKRFPSAGSSSASSNVTATDTSKSN
jgi:hypothetical protein